MLRSETLLHNDQEQRLWEEFMEQLSVAISPNAATVGSTGLFPFFNESLLETRTQVWVNL
jgi:hypothetical protein